MERKDKEKHRNPTPLAARFLPSARSAPRPATNERRRQGGGQPPYLPSLPAMPSASIGEERRLDEEGEDKECLHWCNSWGAKACTNFHCEGCTQCHDGGDAIDVGADREQEAAHAAALGRPCVEDFVQINYGRLSVGPRPLFLNGINLAWLKWGADFTLGGQHSTPGAEFYCGIERAMRFVRSNGGNAMRVWLFTDPQRQLKWDGSSRLLGPAEGVVLMAQTLLETAAHYGVHVVLVLFNGAYLVDAGCRLFQSDEVLASLIQRVIKPLATALSGYGSLAMYEVINEPEGLIDPKQPPTHHGGGTLDPSCSDVHGPLMSCPSRQMGPGHEAGWNKACSFSLSRVQLVINRLAAALHRMDSNHLVTIGTTSFCAMSEGRGFGSRNLFDAACLRDAGGDELGTIDVFQMHTYPRVDNGRSFPSGSPARTPASIYNADAPILIGATSPRWVDKPGGGPSVATVPGLRSADMHVSARENGFAGIFSWAYGCDTRTDGGCVSQSELAAGMRAGAEGKDVRLPDQLAHIRNYHSCDCPADQDKSFELKGRSCAEAAAQGKCQDARTAKLCPGPCANCGEPLQPRFSARACSAINYESFPEPPPPPSSRASAPTSEPPAPPEPPGAPIEDENVYAPTTEDQDAAHVPQDNPWTNVQSDGDSELSEWPRRPSSLVGIAAVQATQPLIPSHEAAANQPVGTLLTGAVALVFVCLLGLVRSAHARHTSRAGFARVRVDEFVGNETEDDPLSYDRGSGVSPPTSSSPVPVGSGLVGWAPPPMNFDSIGASSSAGLAPHDDETHIDVPAENGAAGVKPGLAELELEACTF